MIKHILTLACFVLCITTILGQDWKQLKDTPFFKHHSNGFGYEGKAYIIEGTRGDSDENGISNEVWEYTPETDSWKRLNDFPGPGRAIAIGDDMNGKYYYGFGSGAIGLLNDLWEYDPLTDTFLELPTCPCEGRSHPALVAHNNKIFMGSGSGQQNDLTDWWILDLETMEWSEKEDIPGARRHHPFQFGIDNAIYVGGGHISNWSRWDIESETWTQIDNLPGGRVAGSQFSYNGKGYVLSGDSASHGSLEEDELFMEYDSEADIWTSLPPHPGTNRWACSSFIIDEALYLFGGYPFAEEFIVDSSMWKFDMSLVGCLAPSSLNAVSVSDTEAGLFWFSNSNSKTDTLLWRKVGDPDWTAVVDAQAVYTLSGLEACQEYEFKVLSVCDDLTSNYSETYNFTSDGCCTTPALMIAESAADINVEWESILAAEEYQLRWKTIESNDWMMSTVTGTEYIISNVDPCTEYEFQIKPICLIKEVEYSSSTYYLSKGCGVCIDDEYCAMEYADSDNLFIDEVVIGDFQNMTGNNGGFGNYVMPDGTELKLGETYDIEVNLGSEDNFIFGSIGVWIDFDGDGEFSNVEEQVLFEEFVQESTTVSITIPSTSVVGLTRMRVLCTWDIDFEPCYASEFEVGEVEDYCVNIVSSSKTLDYDTGSQVIVYPNPFSTDVIIDFGSENTDQYSVKLFDAFGKKMFIRSNQDGNNKIVIAADHNLMTPGVYYCHIENTTNSEKLVKKIILMD